MIPDYLAPDSAMTADCASDPATVLRSGIADTRDLIERLYAPWARHPGERPSRVTAAIAKLEAALLDLRREVE